MSAYLGKIHYWLFNKIRYSEELEHKIERWAFEEGLISAAEWKSEILAEFGPTTGSEPLENIIDQTDIHGWLQDKINRSESRIAAWITNILTLSRDYKKQLIDIFSSDGFEKGTGAKDIYEINSPFDAYKVINDYILEGMPCDSVDRPLVKEDDKYSWMSTVCIHSPNWQIVGGDIQHFYDLRKEWLASFIKALDKGYSFNVEYIEGTRINTISK
ncbi:hypothetical protein [Clostridium thermarum]|uniref:hypothetical protein n=1 Tax=Clostridium thermarum TaxID=1716543 RepID=UPI0011207BEC|nr:hypothetical protein [Clostridium thermarum]